MTRYDPHPQDHDDARKTADAPAETEHRLVCDQCRATKAALRAARRDAERAQAALRQVRRFASSGHSGTGAERLADVRMVVDTALSDEADAPAQAPEPSGDVVEQATQVLYDVHGAEPRIKAHALADAGLLIPADYPTNPEGSWRPRAERAETRAIRAEDRARAAEARARRAEDALRAVRVEVAATRRRLLERFGKAPVTNIMDAFCERLDRALSAADQTSDTTPSDAGDGGES